MKRTTDLNGFVRFLFFFFSLLFCCCLCCQVGSGSSPWLQAVRGKWVSNARGAVDADGRRYDNYDSSTTASPTPLFYFGYGGYPVQCPRVRRARHRVVVWLLMYVVVEPTCQSNVPCGLYVCMYV